MLQLLYQEMREMIMINFLEAVMDQLHQFVETGHSKPIHLM